MHFLLGPEMRPLVGKSIRDIKFRSRYNAVVLAVHREGVRVHARVGDVVLHPGQGPQLLPFQLALQLLRGIAVLPIPTKELNFTGPSSHFSRGQARSRD